MPIYHATLFFAQDRQGWVEQFWRVDSSLPASLARALSLAQARYSIIGAGVNLWRVRVSQLGSPRLALSAPVEGVTLSLQAEDAHQCAEIDLQAGPTGLYHRSYALGGLPRGSLIVSAGFVLLASALAGPVRSWLALLTSDGWRLECWGRDSPQYRIQCLTPSRPAPADPLDPRPGFPTPNPFGDGAFAVLNQEAPVPPAGPGVVQSPTVRIGRVKPLYGGKFQDATACGEFPLLWSSGGVVAYRGPIPLGGVADNSGYLQIRQRLYLPISRAVVAGSRSVKRGPAPKSLDVPAAEQSPLLGLLGGLGQQGAVAAEVLAVAVQQLAPYLGAVGVPPVIPPPGPPPVPPPPVPNPLTPVVPPIPAPAATTCNTLGDVALLIHQQLLWSGFDQDYMAVGIAPVTNLANTWLVACCGVDQFLSGTTSFLRATAHQIVGTSTYSQRAEDVIAANVPAGAKVLLYGYSFGGMVGETLVFSDTLLGRVTAIVTFGSPMGGISTGIPITRFRVENDLVPTAGILSIISELFSNIGYQITPNDPAHPTFPGCHTAYLINPDLIFYNVFGEPIETAQVPLYLGPFQKFSVNPPG